MKYMNEALKKKSKEKKYEMYKQNPAYPKIKKGKLNKEGETPAEENAEMMDIGKT